MKRLPWFRDWIVPLVAAIVVAGVGWWANLTVEKGLKQALRGELQAILDADVAALRYWMRSQQAIAEMAADDARVRDLVGRLVAAARTAPTPEILGSPDLAELRAILAHTVNHSGYVDFVVVEPSGRTIAALNDAHLAGC